MAATIPSATKERSPPDAISCLLVDHANARTLQEVFDRLVRSKDDAMVEKLAHTMALHCRMHNQALMEVVVPLAEGLSGGGELGASIKAKVLQIEQLLAAVDATKKHLDNDEFVEAMQKKKEAEAELMALAENDLLPALLEELEAGDLLTAAQQMEEAKIKAPLLPQAEALAA